tara:strand:+ start:880 stop:1224 length:345 start_codon:yes stop_codon:yes gene_type:complete
MAKQYEFDFMSATVDPKKSIKAGFDLDSGQWQATQNIQQYVDGAKEDRDKEAYFGRTRYKGFRKMATIPDIVALKIKEDYGIDLHDQTFMRDTDKMKKLKTILKLEYPHLIVNT